MYLWQYKLFITSRINAWVLSRFSCVQLFETLWTVTHQAPRSMGFSRQEYWSRLPWPSPGDLPNQGWNQGLLHWQAGSLHYHHPGSPTYNTSLAARMVKHLPTMRETWVQSLGWEDLLEKEMATHSSLFAWKTPRTEEPGRLQSMGSQRVGHDWTTSLTHSNSLMHPCHYKPFYMKSNFPKDDGLL